MWFRLKRLKGNHGHGNFRATFCDDHSRLGLREINIRIGFAILPSVDYIKACSFHC